MNKEAKDQGPCSASNGKSVVVDKNKENEESNIESEQLKRKRRDVSRTKDIRFMKESQIGLEDMQKIKRNQRTQNRLQTWKRKLQTLMA